MNKKVVLLLALVTAFIVTAAPKAKATQYEPNRLELIQPVKMGQLVLRPTFNSCSFYYGTDKLVRRLSCPGQDLVADDGIQLL